MNVAWQAVRCVFRSWGINSVNELSDVLAAFGCHASPRQHIALSSQNELLECAANVSPLTLSGDCVENITIQRYTCKSNHI